SDENFNWVQSIKNKGRQGKADLMKQFEITFRENGIKSEAEQLAVWRAVKEWQLPADPRLANAYKSIMGINGDVLKKAEAAGRPIIFMEGYMPRLLTSTKVDGDEIDKRIIAISGHMFGVNDSMSATKDKTNMAFKN